MRDGTLFIGLCGEYPGRVFLELKTLDALLNISSIFLDVFLGLLPYFMGGILLSGFLEVFVSRNIVQKMSRRGYAAVAVMCLLGGLLPVANGGAMPLARRMLKKGMPFYAVLTFISAAPLLNIISAINSSLALGWENWFFLRWLPGVILAVGTGCVFGRYSHELPGMDLNESNLRPRWRYYCDTVVDDFLAWIPVLIPAALLAAILRYFLPFSTWVDAASTSQVLQVLISIFYAMIISASSTVDSFIIMNWVGHISIWPIFAFLLSSALLNLVNVIMAVKALGSRAALYWSLWSLLCIILFTFFLQLAAG